MPFRAIRRAPAPASQMVSRPDGMAISDGRTEWSVPAIRRLDPEREGDSLFGAPGPDRILDDPHRPGRRRARAERSASTRQDRA
ncbi:hypothetical protein EBB05_19310 [Methylobacterium brachiatum]|nr:hypothetical protein EBB05_19310 [Methylobacterium brachiatum]